MSNCQSYQKLKRLIQLDGKLKIHDQTMNDVIKLMLGHNVIDLDMIQHISNMGSVPDNTDKKNKNTLSRTIKCLTKNNQILSDENERKEIVPLFILLGKIGAMPSNVQKSSNAFSLVVKLAGKMKSTEIIECLINLGVKPNNGSMESGNLNTLEHAIKTQNTEIIKITLENGATQSRETFNHVVKTNNLEIIKFAVAMGLAPCGYNIVDIRKDNFVTNVEYLMTSFDLILKYMLPNKQSMESINIIKTIMCTGVIISNYSYMDAVSSIEYTLIDQYVNAYYNIIYPHPYSKAKTKAKDKTKSLSLCLRNELKDLTDCLIEISTNNIKIKKELYGCLLNVPTDCIDIVHGYLKNKPLFQPIDWMNI